MLFKGLFILLIVLIFFEVMLIWFDFILGVILWFVLKFFVVVVGMCEFNNGGGFELFKVILLFRIVLFIIRGGRSKFFMVL